jgi:integrase
LVEQLGVRTVERWLEEQEHVARATARMYLSRVRGFCRRLQRRKLIRRDPTLDVDPIRVPRPVDRAFTSSEVAELLAVPPDGRARAIVWLLLGCGLRRCEVSRLEKGDYERTDRTFTWSARADTSG